MTGYAGKKTPFGKLAVYQQAKPSKMRNRPIWNCPACDWLGHSPAGSKKQNLCPACSAHLLHFQSQKELNRWNELKLLQKQGQIRNLERQVRIPLQVNGVQLKTAGLGKRKPQDMVYVADFDYQERRPGPDGCEGYWAPVLEEVKGRKSSESVQFKLYWLKREILRANGIEVREI